MAISNPLSVPFWFLQTVAQHNWGP